jgi:hypothetical protein
VALVGMVDVLDLVGRAEEGVDAPDERELELGRVLRPVLAVGHEKHGPRRGQRRDLGVVRLVARAPVNRHAALADAAAEEVGRDLAHRHGHLHPVIDRGQQKRLRAAARAACHADSRSVHAWPAQQKVERADAVPRLEAEHLGRLLVRPACLLPVAVADHVVEEHERAHARQHGASRLPLGLEAAVVAVRTEDRGQGARILRGTVEGSGHEESGRALDGHVHGRVAVEVPRRAEAGMQGRLRRQGREPGPLQDACPQQPLASPPSLRVPVGGEQLPQFLARLLRRLAVAHAKAGRLSVRGEHGRCSDAGAEEGGDPRLH